MPGTSTWKMLTFSLLELTSSTAYRKKRFLTRNPMVYDTLNFSIKQSALRPPTFQYLQDKTGNTYHKYFNGIHKDDITKTLF